MKVNRRSPVPVPIKTRSGPIISRSNRATTEFACSNLDSFLSSSRALCGASAMGNTTTKVSLAQDGLTEVFEVYLFNEPILRVSRGPSVDGGVSICTSFTSYYDHFGQPTATTAERLNGLLDRLGALNVIPEGVRVFRDKSGAEPITYIGRGDNKVAVGDRLARAVIIASNPSRFDFAVVEAGVQ